MRIERLDALVEKYLSKTASRAEQEELFAWYDAENDRDLIWLSADADEEENLRKRILARIVEEAGIRRTIRRRLWPKLAGIAAAVAILGFGAYLFTSHLAQEREASTLHAAALNVAPGQQGATLTLANGRVIPLSAAQSGVSLRSGQLRYEDGSRLNENIDEARTENGGAGARQLIAQTAKGQTYAVTLQDGTKVWLNAASKLTFPSDFDRSAQRIVELQGEAYFAVAHDGKKPFKVRSAGQEVEDIGTEFNIKAYRDEAISRTTLVEGRAKVNGKELSPEQQAIQQEGRVRIQTADTREATAWKNGYFRFSKLPLDDLMKQISRWYNIEIIYESKKAAQESYTGIISRKANLAEMLDILKGGEVRYKIEDQNGERRLIITD